MPAMDGLTMFGQVDDSFHSHPKRLWLISQPDGAAALGLWVTALSWAKQHTTSTARPGHIPPYLPGALMGPDGDKYARLLATAPPGFGHGLWEDAPGGGWDFHDFGHWQQLDRYQARSKAARTAAQARWGTQPTLDGDGDDAGAMPAQSGPHDAGSADAMPLHVPTTTTTTTTREANASLRRRPGDDLALAAGSEVERLCNLLADLITENGSKRPTVTQGWRDACRLMLARDKHTAGQVEAAIRWCQADEFWRANILSMPTLRRQYDKLRLAAQRKPGRRKTGDEQWADHLRLAAELQAEERSTR